ncbi:hypothetical protein [Virgibacillus kimchii]
MKKFLLILLIPVFLMGCSGNNDQEVEASEDKKEEMSESAGLNYLEQITYRYINASYEDDESFEQRSELQASVKRAETMKEEIQEKYDEDVEIAAELILLADIVIKASEEILDENYSRVYENSEQIGFMIGDISNKYLDGELPPTAKHKIH